MSFIKKYPLAFLMLVSIVMLLSHLGIIQTNIMEARNLITAREMVHDGHWIFTTINGQPRYEKPPLPTWISAVFGYACNFKNMFVLRLPVVLVCLTLVYFFYKLMKKFQLPNNQPLHASLILITSFYIFFGGRDNQWDMYTHAFMLVSIYYLVCAFNETNNTATNVLLSTLFFGLSFLSKGPVSLYALFLSFIIAYFIVYKNYTKRNIKLLLFVFVAGLIIGLSWPLYVKYFDVYAGTALQKQTENWGNYDVQPFWHYWSFFMQSGIWTVPSFIGLMYFYLRRRVSDTKAYTFSFLWTIIGVLLLSFIPEKKMRYTLPVLIPLAMNTGFYIEYLITNFKLIKNKGEIFLAYFSFGLIALVAFAVPFAGIILFKSKLNDYIFWFALLVLISVFCGIVIVRSLIKKQFIYTFYATILMMCGVVFTAIPLSKMFYTNVNYYSAANLHSLEKKFNIKTYEGDDFIPEITWDYGDKIPNLTKDSSVIMPQDSVFGLLVSNNKATDFINTFTGYSFTPLAQVDLNAVSKNTKGHSERLTKDYYLVRKKM